MKPGIILKLLMVLKKLQIQFQCSSSLDFILFADDTNIICSNDDPDTLETVLNKDLHIISNWFKLNKLSLNVAKTNYMIFKGVLHPWALFLKTLCIFPKNKATSDKVSYGSGQKCSKELKNHSFTSVETIVVKLQWKMCENQYFPCFEP